MTVPDASPKFHDQVVMPLGTLATAEAAPLNAVGIPDTGRGVVTAIEAVGVSWVRAQPAAALRA